MVNFCAEAPAATHSQNSASGTNHMLEDRLCVHTLIPKYSSWKYPKPTIEMSLEFYLTKQWVKSKRIFFNLL